MRERGILMSGPMVRAILAGRKTQTRRAMRTSHVGYHSFVRWDGEPYRRAMMRCMNDPGIATGDPHLASVFCEDNRYGVPGDRLWVRETTLDDGAGEPGNIHYRANATAADIADLDARGLRWTPSLLMPRSRCRIILAVESIRVERAQDISDADIAAEGVDAEAVEALWAAAKQSRRAELWPFAREALADRGPPADWRAIDNWRAAWTLINGRESWDANPWVWVVEFMRVDDHAGRPL